MDWPAVAVILGATALLGAAVTALPPIWRFVKAAAKVPQVVEGILDEFTPNGGGTLRDGLDRLERMTVRLEEGVLANATLLAEHTQRDDLNFDRQEEAVTRIHELIGEPGPDDAATPLIPYVHEMIHNLNNRLAVNDGIPQAQTQVLSRAVKVITDMERKLAEDEADG